MRRLGIDPGGVTGWAVVDVEEDGQYALVASGEIDTRLLRPWPEAADTLREALEDIIHTYRPAEILVEIPMSKTFLATFLGTAAIAKSHEFVGIASKIVSTGSSGAAKYRAKRTVRASEHVHDAIAMCIRP